MNKYTVIDLFSGCGGLSLGLHNAGWSGVFAIEKNPLAFQTLEANLIDTVHHFDWPSWLPRTFHDINEVLANYSAELKNLSGKVVLVAGGPPCQGFSMAGRRQENDYRNQLVFSYIRFVELVQPRIIMFENVRGFLSPFTSGGIPYSELVKKQLERLGYKVHYWLIDFSQFGVPQRRCRFIMVGLLDGDPLHFMDFLLQEKKKFLNRTGLSGNNTVSDAISDLLQSNGTYPTPDRKGFLSGCYGEIKGSYQKFMRGCSEVTIGNIVNSHSFARHNQETVALFCRLLSEATPGVRISGKMRNQWGIKKRGLTLLNSDSQAPTLTSHPDDFLHYCEPRILTVREYARLQSFPDWFVFKGKYTTGGKLRVHEVPRYTQIGNAIPPMFAEIAGGALKKMVNI